MIWILLGFPQGRLRPRQIIEEIWDHGEGVLYMAKTSHTGGEKYAFKRVGSDGGDIAMILF